jgi:phage portal protein BeeE
MGRLKRAGQALLGTALEPAVESRSLDWYLSLLQQPYQYMQAPTLGGKEEHIDPNYRGLVYGAFMANGPIFACMEARRLLFSEARFQFRQFRNGRPGDLFGTPELKILEQPDGPNASTTTGDLLSRIIGDVDLAGNFFGVRRPGPRLIRLEPDWVTILRGTKTGNPLDYELAGYAYTPGGPGSGEDPIGLTPNEVVHVAGTPDPLARWKGMSWLRPVIEEIMGDKAAMTHKLKFFEQGATVNTIAVMPPDVGKRAFDMWVDAVNSQHRGVENAYKMMFMGAGADVKTIGADMKQIDFKVVQGHGETRICAAARVPPIIVGLSEGLDSATYSNYASARRAFADLTMRPLWRNTAGSLASVLTMPAGADLWYDDRDIPFLQEDLQDAAAIQETQSKTIHNLIIAGYEPDSVIQAVISGDMNRLLHTGLFSVQLQPAGTIAEGKGSTVGGTIVPAPAGNGASSTP